MADKIPEKNKEPANTDTPEDTKDFLLLGIRRLKEDMDALTSDRVDAMSYYRSDPSIVEQLENRSNATTTDLMDLVEWAKPALLEVFASGDEACSLEPKTAEDTEAVHNLDLLINHQLRVQNNWFMVLHDWLDDCLKLKTGWLKYQWYKDVKEFDKEYEGLNEDEYQTKLKEENATITRTVSRSAGPQIPSLTLTEPLGVQPAPVMLGQAPGPASPPVVNEYDITVHYRIESEYPLIEAIPAENFGFPIRCRNVEDFDFCYHKVPYPKWKMIKLFGETKFKEVEDAKGRRSDTLQDDQVQRARLEDLGGDSFFYDEKVDEYWVYECFYRDEKDGTPMVAPLCADVLMAEPVKNKYRKPPFHGITPIKMAHRIAGFSFYDLAKEIMQIRTALLRQILDNTYFANNRRYFGDPERFNVDDYLKNNFPGALVRTIGDPRQAVMPEEKAPLPPEVFQFWEMLNVEKDYHSGVPRSFQGVNPNVLNKTWRGQNEQVSQASQRIAMMARLIAEMGVAPLVRDIVDINLWFLKKKQAVRFLNTWKEISPDQIIGQSDVVVNVGLGTSNKQQTIVFVQQLLAIYQQLKAAGINIVTPKDVFNAMKELIRAMGFRNVADFVTDPKFTEQVTVLLATLGKMGLAQDPNVGPIAMAVATQLGLLPPPGSAPQGGVGGENTAGTSPGAEPPAIPEQPAGPGQPTLPSIGGNVG